MNRRTVGQIFLSLPALLAKPALMAAENSRQKPSTDSMNLPALRVQLRKDLVDDYLPFMQKFVIDPEYGGFMCNVRPNGERVSTNKVVWYEGRGAWVYSFLYNNLEREPKYLEIARRSIELLQKSKPKDANEFCPKGLNRDGSPSTPPDPELYSDMFIAEGLAEFSKATGERKYWNEARDIVLKCVRRYDGPDYYPEIGQTYLGPTARPFPGARIEGVWMVLIRTTTQMLEMHPDSELEQISKRATGALLDHHYNPRFQLINELMNHDLSRPANEYEELVYAGHAIETLWMVMYEARRRKDTVLFDRAAGLFRRHCELAKDRVYGGLFRNLTNVDQNAWTMDKTLFPQQEALTGCMCLIEEFGDPWAIDFYSELNTYVRAKFPMRSLDSPLWQVKGDRQVTPDPDMTRAENYHQPRYLMLNLLAIDRIVKRRGTPLRAV